MSINNCATCRYKQLADHGLHCYMFRTEPEGVCAKHTARKSVVAILHGGTGIVAAVAAILAQEKTAVPLPEKAQQRQEDE